MGAARASSTQEVPARKYPGSDMAAHLFGYVGEVSEPSSSEPDYEGVEPGSIVGQAGVELAYNKLLMGTDGSKTVVVNSVGREIGQPLPDASVPAAKGDALQLTIDADVQKATEDGFDASGFNGAAVVLDPRNGEVLAFTSRPAYDPNAFAGGNRSRDVGGAEHRRAEAAAEPRAPGPLLAGLDVQDGGRAGRARGRRHHAGLPRSSAAAAQTFYGRFFKCWKKGGHGSVDLRHAIEQSCDVFFYTVGNMLGVDRINKWATLFGLGVKSGIDLPNEVQGLVPSTAVESAVTKEKKWYAGETISVAIGQGQVSVTPVSMAVYTATLANGGTRVTPHLIKAVDDGTGLEAGAAAAAAVEGRSDAREAPGDPRRHVGGRQRRPGTGGGRGSPATTSAARPAPRR